MTRRRPVRRASRRWFGRALNAFFRAVTPVTPPPTRNREELRHPERRRTW